MTPTKMSLLSNPLHFEGTTLEEKIGNGCNHFYHIFCKKEVKPLYNGMPIFFNMDKNYNELISLPWPERIMHLISLSEKKVPIYPCNNDISFESCNCKCIIEDALISFVFLDRFECLYRLSRIHWIPEIIKLANDGNKDISSWDALKSAKGQAPSIHRHIRYCCGVDDFLIILKFRKKLNDYQFVTAYPLFIKKDKERYTEEFNNVPQK